MDTFETFQTLMDRGGPLMWPLLVLSVIAVSIAIERTVFWVRLNGRKGSATYSETLTALRTGQRIEPLRSPFVALARRMQAEGASLDESSAVASCEEVRPVFDRGLTILSTIITAAPMLGILGTVLGIIESFELLGGDSSISDPTQVSGGIAEALITTAAGLVVALVALFPSMVFRTYQDRAIGRMEAIIAAALRGRAAIFSEPETVNEK
jgi:biopolymer transport protein ExbB